MQRLLIPGLLSLLIVTRSVAQKNETRIAGTVAIDAAMSMKATEATVRDWIEYLINNERDTALFPARHAVSPTIAVLFDELRNGSTGKYFIIIHNPGSSYNGRPEKSIEPNKTLKKLFDSDSNYCSLIIPITGITVEQAEGYCAWKEKVVNRGRAVPVRISLPTIDIYKRVIPNIDSLNAKKCALFNWANCNCATELKGKSSHSQGKCLLRADYYWPSDLGLYNLQGNAAEMTATKGTSMGGSFRHSARQSFSDTSLAYEGPQDWLGFRYIVTLK